jgi:hypothetical protein
VTGAPRNPRAGRQRYLVGFLRWSLLVTAVAAVLAVVLGSDDGGTPARIMVALLIALPLLRIAWLTLRWARLGDWRFALAGVGLLSVVAAGALVAG